MCDRLSEERRQISVLAAVTASTSSMAFVMMRGHSRAMRVWAGAEFAVLAILIVKMVRLRMKGDRA